MSQSVQLGPASLNQVFSEDGKNKYETVSWSPTEVEEQEEKLEEVLVGKI